MSIDTAPVHVTDLAQLALSTRAARNLATTTKSRPQMREISPRWLLRKLPWVDTPGGTYRVNRRLSYPVGHGRVSFLRSGGEVRVIPPSLRELPVLRGFPDEAVLHELAGRFLRRDFARGDVIAQTGRPIDEVLLVVHGKVDKVGAGEYGESVDLGLLSEGDHLGDQALTMLMPPGATQSGATWRFTARATTDGTLLGLPWRAFQQLVDRYDVLRTQILHHLADGRRATNRKGEADISLSAGHAGEPALPGTFVDYELAPREYELSVAQTVLRVHTRVADLYNEPMDQVDEQLRLTAEALRERQEHELVNNRDFGLLHNVDHKQRIHTRSGPPTPADLDALVSMRRKTRMLLAHPRAIAAFGQECNRQGIYPGVAVVDGSPLLAWRGVPFFPCDKIPVTDGHTSAILALRTGEDDQGVVGLHQTGLPDEYQPGLSVRLRGVDARAVVSYVASAYYSVAVLVPDALGVLDNVAVSRPRA